MYLAAYCWVVVFQITLLKETLMKVHQPLAVISLIALITTFATTSFAKDDITMKAKKLTTGQVLQSHVPGCSVTITNPNNFLYLDRSQQKIKITQVPPGTYSVLKLTLGWVQIAVNGWAGWIQGDTGGVTGLANQKNQRLRIASKTASCPTRN